MSPIMPSRFPIFKSVSDILNCYGFFGKSYFLTFFDLILLIGSI